MAVACDDLCSHTWVDGAVITAASCKTTGSQKRVCSKCGAEGTPKTLAIAEHNHFESLICKYTSCDHQYELGDTGPAGGIIFYVNATGFKLYQGAVTTSVNAEADNDTYITAHYLEAWTENGGTRVWSSTNVDVPQAEQEYTALGDWIGYGLRNTRIIVAALENAGENNRAAQVASSVKGGYNDWFLPSIDELYAMYIAKADPNNVAGLPAGTNWWSSSQSDDTARELNFNDGSMGATVKPNTMRNHRAVRAF
ncbi:MAG: DUF1566 domain-containing protein [Treponema sp.]|nr:DUF1566 domain-containing protein [Treponema sp.]